jgi:hypothetical protein
MKLFKAGLLSMIVLLAAAVADAQDPHVYSEYKEPLKATIVYTDRMYLLNTPEQVVDVEFNFRLKRKQSRKQPERVDLMLWSYSRELKYQKDKDRDISLNADGETVKIEKVMYMPFQQRKKDFERIKDAYAEWIILYLSPEEAKKLATAKKIKLQIGKQEMSFTDNYMNTIRDFASRIPTQ